MAVAYDNSVTATGFNVTSVTSGSFTISGSNRAAIVCLRFTTAVTNLTVTVGGVSGSQITGGTATTASGYHLYLWQVIAPAAGSQTASATWTETVPVFMTVMTFTGVDQTTPVTNGFGTNNTDTSIGASITSNSGDLTATCAYDELDDALMTTNQIQEVTAVISGDVGPGTGTTTHTWTTGHAFITNNALLGGNIKAAAAGGFQAAWALTANQGVGFTQPAEFP